MEENVDITVDFAGVRLANPVFTASGTCGYADELADFMDVKLQKVLLSNREKETRRRGLSRPIRGCLMRSD